MSSNNQQILHPHSLAAQQKSSQISVVDVREPMEYVGGHIPGSHNIPLAKLHKTKLPAGPLVLVCQTGNRSNQGLRALISQGHSQPLAELAGGMNAWQQAELPVNSQKHAPLPLMRQVQIAAGSLVLLGVILSQTVAPGWIFLAGFVGAGLVFAGISGFCGMARLLVVMPWNQVQR